MRRLTTALAAAAVVLVAACGGSGGHVTGSASTAPVTSSSVNKLVCEHYLRQYAWKQHLAFPTIADALKWEGYVAADQAEATLGTKLSHDLGQEYLAMQSKKNTYKNGTVYRDCASLR